jgi:hypothetical protein
MVVPESMVSPEGDAAGVPIRFKYEVNELATWEKGRLVGEAAGNCAYELEPVTFEGRLTNAFSFLSIDMLCGLRSAADRTLANPK